MAPVSVRATLDEPFLLPIEISDIGYVNVTTASVWVSVPNVDHTFQVGDQLSLLQKNMFYYIALDDRADSPRRVVAVRRQLGDGQGSAWVTEQKDLIFGTATDTESGMFYLRPNELMPVVAENDTSYVVLCERYAEIFELNVPKSVRGISFVRHLPKSLVRQLKRREEMRQRIVLREEWGQLGVSPLDGEQPAPMFQAEIVDEGLIRPTPTRAGSALPGQNRTESAPVQVPQPFPGSAAAVATQSNGPSVAKAAGSTVGTGLPPRKPKPRATAPAVPERIPETPPIEVERTSQLVAELAQVILVSASNSTRWAEIASAGPVPRSADAAGMETDVSAGQTERGAAAELSPEEGGAGSSGPELEDDASLAEEPNIPFPALAMPGTASTQPESAREAPVVTGVASAAIKVLVLVIVATLSFFLVLFVMAKLVNGRPRPRLVETKKKKSKPAPPPAMPPMPSPTGLIPPPVAPREPTQLESLAAPSDQGSSSSTFTGSLHGFHISELIQFLNSTKETGTLTITENDNLNQARVIFDQGEIVNAFYGEMDAAESLAEILAFDDGFFVFKRQEEVFAERVIQQSTMSLLMNMHQKIDERVLDTMCEPDGEDVFHRAPQSEVCMADALPSATGVCEPPPPPAPAAPPATAAQGTQVVSYTSIAADEDNDVFRRANAPAVGDTILGHSIPGK